MDDTETQIEFNNVVAIDPISLAVGCNYYISNYRFDDLCVLTELGRSPRLAVSRYYWDMERPVVVDMIRDLRMGEAEFATKKTYFKAKNMRYVLARDVWDGDGVEVALRAFEPNAEEIKAIQDASKPLVGPRRKATTKEPQ